MTISSAISPGYTSPLPWQVPAVSDAARMLKSLRESFFRKGIAAASVSAPLYAAFKELELITSEVREDVGHTDEVLEHLTTSEALAKEFLKLLPPHFQAPDFTVEPNGSVAMEWRPERGRVLIVSFVAVGRVEYAGLDGITNRFHGSAVFVDRVPEKIIEYLQRIRLN